jgi:hypothetical protein
MYPAVHRAYKEKVPVEIRRSVVVSLGNDDVLVVRREPELRESSILLSTNSSHVVEKPTKRRAPLKDVTHILSASE